MQRYGKPGIYVGIFLRELRILMKAITVYFIMIIAFSMAFCVLNPEKIFPDNRNFYETAAQQNQTAPTFHPPPTPHPERTRKPGRPAVDGPHVKRWRCVTEPGAEPGNASDHRYFRHWRPRKGRVGRYLARKPKKEIHGQGCPFKPLNDKRLEQNVRRALKSKRPPGASQYLRNDLNWLFRLDPAADRVSMRLPTQVTERSADKRKKTITQDQYLVLVKTAGLGQPNGNSHQCGDGHDPLPLLMDTPSATLAPPHATCTTSSQRGHLHANNPNVNKSAEAGEIRTEIQGIYPAAPTSQKIPSRLSRTQTASHGTKRWSRSTLPTDYGQSGVRPPATREARQTARQWLNQPHPEPSALNIKARIEATPPRPSKTTDAANAPRPTKASPIQRDMDMRWTLCNIMYAREDNIVINYTEAGMD
ncbi:hypothetical protein BV898_19767 [Hypsibius exemplaris]|uniref:Uncharacterized protein n=1 Tax=Hypsibius exemplaris TaxID=2072580 RepID=A0A9X6RPE2_HYPEX|nr:hypothetical protein BV898_19767 [Hypsibius exemplaris]